MPPVPTIVNYAGLKEKALDNLADVVSRNVDMGFIKGILGL